MAQFDPKMLAPASAVPAFAKDAGARTTKQVALDNIEKMRALFQDAKLEGKRNFTTKGDHTAFNLRVNNTALDLEVFVNGKDSTAKEVSVPTAMFLAALDHYKAQVEGDKYKDALAALESKRTARTDKMRATRAAKPKKDEAKKPA